MSCRWSREALSAILDGEATGDDVVVVRSHLARCPACRAAAARAYEVTRVARGPRPLPRIDLVAILLDGRDRTGPEAGDVPERQHRTCAHHPERPLGVAGNAACGCVRECSCGCQDGRPCRCGGAAA